MTTKARTTVYWVTTGLLLSAMLSGGIAELVRAPGTIKGMSALGYPPYFVTIIGTWKILATVALLVPGFTRLKEWAYAGIFFNMTGAAVSHAVTGDPRWHVVVTLALAALAIASWALRPAERTLGVLFQQKGGWLHGHAPTAAGL